MGLISILNTIIYSSVAQLAEQVAVNHPVAGSSPAVGAIKQKKEKYVSFWMDWYLIIGYSQIGKAAGFGPVIWRFESFYPSQ